MRSCRKVIALKFGGHYNGLNDTFEAEISKITSSRLLSSANDMPQTDLNASHIFLVRVVDAGVAAWCKRRFKRP